MAEKKAAKKAARRRRIVAANAAARRIAAPPRKELTPAERERIKRISSLGVAFLRFLLLPDPTGDLRRRVDEALDRFREPVTDATDKGPM